MPDIEEFERYLKRRRKNRTGDPIMDVTKETYLRLALPVFKDGVIELGKQELIKELNQRLAKSGNPLMVAALRHVMIFKGFYDERSLVRLPRGTGTARSAIKSKQFLQTKVLSEAEVLAMINNASGKPFGSLLFSLLYDTACRREEMKFKISRIDRKKQQINITGKGGKMRQVYYNETTKNLLDKWIDDNDLTDDNTLIEFTHKGFVCKDQGNAMYNYVRKQGENILGRHLHPHMFRHTCLTHMADHGADILDIKAYAGHEKIETSQIYIEVSAHRRQRAFKKYKPDIKTGRLMGDGKE